MLSINEAINIYGRSALALSTLELEDTKYCRNITKSAKETVALGLGHHEYSTQWKSGACRWLPPVPSKIAYVVIAGPDPDQNQHGDEYPTWHVISFDAYDCDIASTSFFSRESAIEKGEYLAELLKVELVNDAGFA